MELCNSATTQTKLMPWYKAELNSVFCYSNETYAIFGIGSVVIRFAYVNEVKDHIASRMDKYRPKGTKHVPQGPIGFKGAINEPKVQKGANQYEYIRKIENPVRRSHKPGYGRLKSKCCEKKFYPNMIFKLENKDIAGF